MRNIICIFLILTGCSDFEFIYDSSYLKSPLINLTKISISGDGAEQAKIYVDESIGNNNNGEYFLSIIISKNTTVQKIETDSTASKFTIEHIMSYALINSKNNGCPLAKEIISTSTNYNAKSAGYDFGTDTSKKEAEYNNIIKNIDKFFIKLRNKNSELECLDAN